MIDCQVNKTYWVINIWMTFLRVEALSFFPEEVLFKVWDILWDTWPGRRSPAWKKRLELSWTMGNAHWACLQTYLELLLPTFLTNPLLINMFLKMLLFINHNKFLRETTININMFWHTSYPFGEANPLIGFETFWFEYAPRRSTLKRMTMDPWNILILASRLPGFCWSMLDPDKMPSFMTGNSNQ